ncbi:MAG TPA: protein adenylyltransferase SelO family protein, partial [Sulfurovum sp.]|nr:protein adenylyltransferase SelO family protein [Sulfurovum sp.]
LALKPLLASNQSALDQLDEIRNGFPKIMQEQMQKMWASKLGLKTFNATLFNELVMLMIDTSVDYTIFFRELSTIPEDIAPLTKSFYGDAVYNETIINRWSEWLEKWKSLVDATTPESREKLSNQMKDVNPKYTLREWFLVPAYKQAAKGDYTLIKELQEVMIDPYAEQSKEIEEKYYREKPSEFFEIAGISHITCSS